MLAEQGMLEVGDGGWLSIVGLVLKFLESWWVGNRGGHYVLEDCPRITGRPVSI